MTLIVMLTFSYLSAQDQYINYKTMSQKINALCREYSDLCLVKSLVKTTGGKDIWLITIGTGDMDNKPGIAVVGGVEGSYIVGKELALGFAGSLLKNSSTAEIKDLINKITFYVLPDVSPDETEQFFAGLKYERVVNARSTDDDRDFVNDEDPYEDLNNDGYITLIRVEDPSGNYTQSEEDNRIMVAADLSKGQTGGYLLFSEGIDNDKDNNYNEDGDGGINFNRNFTFNYEEFGTNAGLYPVSEPETKAVADFLFDRFNIYTVFAFGPQDNLGQPMKSSEQQDPVQSSPGNGQIPPGTFQIPPQNQDPGRSQMRMERRIINTILKSDELINRLVSDKYHEITGVKGAPVPKTSQGNFMEWAYFHYGRYSFSTPGWWFPVEKGKNQDAAFLKFAEKNKLNDVFIPWTEIKHTDFPGKKTEVGGIKPFAMINPPADTLSILMTANYKFITAIAAMHPELEFLDVKTEKIEGDLFRISLKVHNRGIFSTCAEIGDQNMWTRIMQLTLEPEKGQSVISGYKAQRIQRLNGDESAEFSWLIMGKGNIKITAGAINTGKITTTIELR